MRAPARSCARDQAGQGSHSPGTTAGSGECTLGDRREAAAVLKLNDDRVRVLLCDDDPRDLSSVETTLFMAQRTIEVVGTATSASELLALAQRKSGFDVAVIDL